MNFLTHFKVSLDPATKKPVAISPLKAETPEQKLLFKQGEENYNLKKTESKLALRKQTPNDEESDLIHAFWRQQIDYHGEKSDASLNAVANKNQIQIPRQGSQTMHYGWHQLRSNQSR